MNTFKTSKVVNGNIIKYVLKYVIKYVIKYKIEEKNISIYGKKR